MIRQELELEEDVARLLESAVAAGGFPSHSAYLQQLIQQDAQSRELREIDAVLARRSLDQAQSGHARDGFLALAEMQRSLVDGVGL